MAEELFTFMVDFDNGTYLSQFSGSLQDSCSTGIGSSIEGIGTFTETDKAEVLQCLREDELSAIDGLTNVWCMSGLVSELLVLVHIVKADSDKIQNPKSKI